MDEKTIRETGYHLKGTIVERLMLVTPNYSYNETDFNFVNIPIIRYMDNAGENRLVACYPVDERKSYVIRYKDLGKSIEVIFESNQFQHLEADLEHGIFNGKKYGESIELGDRRNVNGFAWTVPMKQMQSMGTTICLADREDVEDYIKNVLIGTGIVVSVTGEDYVAPAPVNPNTKNKNETGL